MKVEGEKLAKEIGLRNGMGELRECVGDMEGGRIRV